MKKIVSIILSLLLVFLFAFSSIGVMAQESDAIDIAQLQEICTRLPNEKTVSLANKDDILTAKKAYDSMDTTQKIELGSENVSKIAVAFEAFTPLLLGDVVARIETLPKNVKKADKAEVKALWEDYNLLPEDARVAVNKNLAKVLNEAVKATNPDLLGEEEQEENQDKENDEKKDNANATFRLCEIIVLCVLAILIIFNIVMVVVVSIKIFKAIKKRA